MTEQSRADQAGAPRGAGEKRRIKMTQHKFNILALLFNGNAGAKQRELLRGTRERAEIIQGKGKEREKDRGRQL